MMTTNLFVIANIKQLRTDGSFRILLPFSQTSCGVGFLNSAAFSFFHNRVEFGTNLGGPSEFQGGGFEPPNPLPPRYATAKFTKHDENFPIVYVSTKIHWFKFAQELAIKDQTASLRTAVLFL